MPCKGVHIRPLLPLHKVKGFNSEKFNRFGYGHLEVVILCPADKNIDI